MTTSPVVALRAVSKRFATVQALGNVDLVLRPGEVHVLLGENGAGKSTATKILAGLETPDEGEVVVDGEPVALRARADSIRRGVGLVAQAGSLAGELTLVENLLLSHSSWLARRRAAADSLRRAADAAGITLELDVPAHALGVAQRQLGELAIALAQGARVLLLDEPTSSLGPHEVGGLFARLRRLAESGVAILFITHRLAEIRQVADVATVLSHGTVSLHGNVSETDDAALLRAMTGELPSRTPDRPKRTVGPVLLRLDEVTASGREHVPLREVSIEVRSGEILGVLGVAGNGQRTLADVAAGVLRPSRGSVRTTGDVAYVPEARSEGLLPHMPAKRSAVLRRLTEPRFARFGVLDDRATGRFAKELFDRHDVRPRDPEVPTGLLSGGNQQKLLVGRELDGAPQVAVLHGPTQGLDVRATDAVRAEIQRAAGEGAAVLLVSSDVDEVRGLADRLIVLFDGRVADQFDAADFDATRVGRAMAGLST
nr:ATP-binding cassette domain-containing protein [Kibdelosporangium phytohabitans]